MQRADPVAGIFRLQPEGVRNAQPVGAGGSCVWVRWNVEAEQSSDAGLFHSRNAGQCQHRDRERDQADSEHDQQTRPSGDQRDHDGKGGDPDKEQRPEVGDSAKNGRDG